MRTEAAGAGFYHSHWWNQNYPKLQVLTVADLLAGKGIDMPPIRQVSTTFKKAPKAKGDQAETLRLLDERGIITIGFDDNWGEQLWTR